MANTEDRFLGFFRSLELLTKKKESYFDDSKIEKFLNSCANTFTEQVSLKGDETKKFFSRIKNLNRQKHFVAKGIGELIREIPAETTNQIDIKNINIQDVVQTRNDISHANFVTHDDRQLAIYATYIEYLLIYLLCKKLGFSSLHSAHYALNGGDARLHLGK